jgi:hypothetical protein
MHAVQSTTFPCLEVGKINVALLEEKTDIEIENQVFTKRGQCTVFIRIKMRNLYTRTMKSGHFGQQ